MALASFCMWLWRWLLWVVVAVVVEAIVYCVRYIILLCYFYYFNVLYAKIKPLMLIVL